MLQVPIPCSFNVKLTTEKAIIIEDLHINDTQFIKEANLPKMYVDNLQVDDKTNMATANVEKWVLRQRRNEERNIDIAAEIADLLKEDMPF